LDNVDENYGVEENGFTVHEDDKGGLSYQKLTLH